MKSVMHDFSRIEQINAPRSQFDLSCGWKGTFDAGYLVPFFCEDVVPGDTFNVRLSALARLSTPIFPIMDNIHLDTQFFFVPLRQVWDNSRKFFGEQDNPTDSIDYTLPQFTSFTPAEDTLHDYLELPPGSAMTPVSIYHRGYNHIYNHWYRDQNLQNSVVVDTDDGPDSDLDYVLLKRGKRHDYFTSCLPWPQKGDAVFLPLGTSAPVTGIGFTSGVFPATAVPVIESGSGGTPRNYAQAQLVDSTTGAYMEGTAATGGEPTIAADLTAATGATINEWREAVQIQKLLERDARGGTRYPELVKNHFGVDFYDLAYRPEYLGGGSTRINVTPVAQTAPDATSGSVGNLGAFGTGAISGHGFTKSFVEHGFVMGIMSIRADLTYQQGIPRKFLKQTRYDIYWPTLAHLGEQAVTNAEIYYTGTATDDDVFGYQERHSEYRYKNSAITSAFRSAHPASLDAWHLSQEFGTLPVLGPTFIEENPPIDRVIATPTEPHCICDCYIDFKAARPMPVFGTPGMTDHF